MLNPAQVTSKQTPLLSLPKMGRFCFAYTGLTGLDVRTNFVQLSKSSQAHPIRKKQRADLGIFLYDEEQKQFCKQKCGKCSQQMNEKVKKNPKIPSVDIIGGCFLRFKQNLLSSLWFYLQ